MKYIKTYEKIDSNIYYFIPYVDKALIIMAIKKLKTTDRTKDKILNAGFFSEIKKDTFIRDGIGLFIRIKSNGDFSYWPCDKNNTKTKAIDHYNSSGFVYGGKVELEDWEIAANKYNL